MQTRLTNTLIYHSSEWLSWTIYGYAEKKGKDSYEHGSSFLFFLLFPCFLSLSRRFIISLLYTIKISRRRSQILVWHSDEPMPVENRSSNNDADDDDDDDDTVITLRTLPLLGAHDRTVNASPLTPLILRVVGLPKKRQTEREREREETDDGIIDYSCIWVERESESALVSVSSNK